MSDYMEGLTDKQRRFVEEFVVDFNATKAAKRAGYSEKTAYSIGQENLKKPEIRTAVRKLQDEMADTSMISKERILAELAKIAFSDLTDVVEIGENGAYKLRNGDQIDGRLLSEISAGRNGTKVKLQDKMKAIELLGRAQAMFTDNLNNQGGLSVTFNIPRPSKPGDPASPPGDPTSPPSDQIAESKTPYTATQGGDPNGQT